VDIFLDDTSPFAVCSRILDNLLDLTELFSHLDSMSLISVFAGFDDPNILGGHL
jgi:hypothetical protein